MRFNPKLRTENNQKKCWKGYDRIHERERIMKARCLLCEKETKRFAWLEGDFAMCESCYKKAFPYMVKAEVLGRGSGLLTFEMGGIYEARKY